VLDTNAVHVVPRRAVRGTTIGLYDVTPDPAPQTKGNTT
jgi:hypothetical protein